jgi:hypothetical protein
MVKVYDSATDEHPNGDGTEFEDERGQERPEYSDLFGAPDFASFIKKPVSQRSRQYERKVQSVLKAGVIGAINVQDFPDAAALLKYGPAFARASGELADSNAKTRDIIDMLTAPSSPVAMFLAASIPLAAQLFRNHEPQVQQVAENVRQTRAQRKAAKKAGMRIPKPEAREVAAIKFFGKRIPIKVRLPKMKINMIGKMLHARATHPQIIVNEVFGDPKVMKALRDLGVFPEAPEGDDNGSNSADQEEAAM